jgi:hypothetical protein
MNRLVPALFIVAVCFLSPWRLAPAFDFSSVAKAVKKLDVDKIADVGKRIVAVKILPPGCSAQCPHSTTPRCNLMSTESAVG